MMLNGKELLPHLVKAIKEATDIRNKRASLSNLPEITPEIYLEELILKQLEGLDEAVKSEKNMEIALSEQKLAHMRALEQARRRIGLVP